MTKGFWVVVLIAGLLALWIPIACVGALMHPLPVGSVPNHPVFLISIVISILFISLAFYHLSYEIWVYTLVCMIPLEISWPIAFLPKLSPLDYVCASMLIIYFWRVRWKDAVRQLLAVVGWRNLGFWTAFFLAGALSVWVNNGSTRGVVRWGEFLFCYFIAALAGLDNRERVCVRLAWVLAALAGVTGAFGLYQWTAHSADYMRVVTFFGQHNSTAAFLSLCLPAVWAVYRTTSYQAASGLLLLVSAGGFIATGSRGAWIGLIGAVALYWSIWRWRWNPRLVITGACGAILALGLFLTLEAPRDLGAGRENLGWVGAPSFIRRGFSHRPFYWRIGLDMLRRRPLLGVGPGNYEKEIGAFLPAKALEYYQFEMRTKRFNMFWVHLHNAYLQIAVEYGLVGLILWACALSLLIMRGIHYAWTADASRHRPYARYFMISVLAFLIHNITAILFINSFDLLAAILLAFCCPVLAAGKTAEWRRHDPSQIAARG